MDQKTDAELNLDGARNASESVSTLRTQASLVFGEIQRECADNEVATILSLTIEPSEDGLFAKVETPFGVGRIVFSPRIGQEGVFGRYVVQKREKDEKDMDVWVTVWAFKVTMEALLTVAGWSEPIKIRTPYRDDWFNVAMHISASLGK